MKEKGILRRWPRLAVVTTCLLLMVVPSVRGQNQGHGHDHDQDPPASLGGPRLRVLGTAQDGGLPHAACTCERCEAARRHPELRRLVASMAVILPMEGGMAPPEESRSHVYLLDATPDVREQLHLVHPLRTGVGRVDRAPVDGVFLTHAHVGHYLGLAFFGFEAVHTRGLDVFATPRMGAFLRDNGPWSQLVSLGNVTLQTLEPRQPVELPGGVTVEAFAVPHRDEFADTMAFVISGPRTGTGEELALGRRVLYVPDTDKWSTWSPSLLDRLDLHDVDVAVVDGTFFSIDELPGRSVESIGHPLMRTTMDLLEDRVRARELQVLFTHLNHSNPACAPRGAARREIEQRGFAVAAEGEEISLRR